MEWDVSLILRYKPHAATRLEKDEIDKEMGVLWRRVGRFDCTVDAAASGKPRLSLSGMRECNGPDARHLREPARLRREKSDLSGGNQGRVTNPITPAAPATLPACRQRQHHHEHEHVECLDAFGISFPPL